MLETNILPRLIKLKILIIGLFFQTSIANNCMLSMVIIIEKSQQYPVINIGTLA